MSRAATIGLGGKALEFASLVPLVTVLPRVLGASDYGLFALGVSIVTIGSGAASLGGPTMVARFVAGAAPDERVPLARAVVRRSVGWRLLAAGSVAAAVLVARPGHVPLDAWVLVLVALSFDVIATLLLQAVLPLGGIVAWSLRYPVQNLTLTVAVLCFYPVWGLAGALLALPAASGAALTLGIVVARPRLRGARAATRLPAGMRRFAIVQGLGGLCQLALHRGPIVAVAISGASDAEVGYAAIAVGIATGLTYAVFQPYVVELPRLVTVDPVAAARWVHRTTRSLLLVLVPAMLVGVVAAEHVVPRLLGDSFAGAAVPVGIALGLVPLAPATAAFNQIAALRLRPELRLTASAVGACAFVVLAVLCVPTWEASGASVALVAGAAMTAAYGAVACPDVIRPGDTVAAVLSAASIVALAMVA